MSFLMNHVNSQLLQDSRISFDLPTILNNLRSSTIPFISDLKWKETLNEQDHDNFIFELRDELLNRVFGEIQNKFLEHEQVKFVVECAYESWKKIIRLNFYFHDPCDKYYRTFGSWSSDSEPEICKQDSWSRGYIGMKKSEVQLLKPEKLDTVLSDYQLIKLDEYPTENKFDTYKPIIYEKHREESIEELYSVNKDQRLGPQHSILNYPFTVTSPATSVHSEHMIINRVISENIVPVKPSDMHFYKRVKRNERERASLVNINLKILPTRDLPAYDPVEEIKKETFPPLRLPATSAVRVKTQAQVQHLTSSKSDRAVNFSINQDIPISSTHISHK